MTVPNELLIEVGLNVVGFLLAGILIALVYSMILQKNKAPQAYSQSFDIDEKPGLAALSAKPAGGKIEFVDFNSKSDRSLKLSAKEEFLSMPANQFQRNRLEVIKQVTEMLNSSRPMQNDRRPSRVVGTGVIKGAANDQ